MRRVEVLPVIVIAVLMGWFGWQHYQRSQASKPDYDNPDAGVTNPRLVDASQLQLPTSSKKCVVVRVSDGDTMVVDCNGSEEKIRFCGIDAPEKTQPLGEESRNNLQRLVNEASQQVIIVPIETDRYGRTVAEVFTLFPGDREKFLNGEQVLAGLAYHYARYSSRCLNRDAIADTEEMAQQKRVGVWDGKRYQTPWDYRKAQRN
jgi:micrococcal nuclease